MTIDDSKKFHNNFKNVEDILVVFREVNRDAAIEMSYKPRSSYIARCNELNINPPKSFYDPKLRSLHPWIARRPRSIARFSTLLALSDRISSENLIKVFDREKLSYIAEQGYPPLISYLQPTPLGENITLCDPMAGGGSIPLESVLLGIKTVAFDYNPVAYLILKASIEYPLKFKTELSEKVKIEAKKLIEYSKYKLGDFFNANDDAYIFSKKVSCSFCNSPLVLLPIVKSNVLGRNMGVILNKRGSFMEVRCSNCGRTFKIKKRELLKNWCNRHTSLLSDIISKKEMYENPSDIHTLTIIKNIKGKYVFARENDRDLFVNACYRLVENIEELREYIPNDHIFSQNRVFRPLLEYGIRYWYEIYNPRQLLALVELTKYIRERSERLIAKDGEFGAAVSLYLSFGISKMVDFNTILTTWNASNKSIRDTVGQYARSRKIDLNVEYCEAVVPYKNLIWGFEPDAYERTGGGICPILDELCNKMEDLNTDVRILQFDAKKITLLGENFVDIINVDPPYFDQHIYSDFSEFFWVVLKNCLKMLIGQYLFSEKIDGKECWKYLNWSPYSPFVPREDELIVRKDKNYDLEVKKYKRNLIEFFKNAYRALKDDGRLVLWFTHKSWDAWESILYSLFVAGFKVIDFIPFVSEHPTRSVALHGEPKLNRTFVIIATKSIKYPSAIENYEKGVYNFCKRVYKYLCNAKMMPREKLSLWEKALTLMAASMAYLTIFANKNEKKFEREIVSKGIGFGLISLLRILYEEKMGKRLEQSFLMNLSEMEKASLLIWVAYKIFNGVGIKFARRICRFCNTHLEDLRNKKYVSLDKQSVRPIYRENETTKILDRLFSS